MIYNFFMDEVFQKTNADGQQNPDLSKVDEVIINFYMKMECTIVTQYPSLGVCGSSGEFSL